MPMRDLRGRARPVFLWLAFALQLAGPLQAHQPGTAPPAAEAPEASVPVAIPVSAIAVQAATLNGLIRSIEQSLEVPATQAKIAEALPALESEVRARAARLEQRLAQGYDRADLDSMQSSWRGISAELSEWEASLARRLKTSDQHRTELERQLAIWAETARTAQEEHAPTAVRAQVTTALNSIRAAQRKLRKSRDATLGLQKNVVALQGRASAQLDAIVDARDEVLRHVFRRGAEPIWSESLGDWKVNRENFTIALAETRDSLGAYAQKKTPRLIFHAFLILALIWAGGRSRRAVLATGGRDGPSIPRALHHPYAAGLVLGLTATVWLHPDAPPKLGQLLALLVLPFWFVVLRRMLPEALRRPLAGLLLLVVLDFLRQLLLDFEILSRGLLILETTSLFVGTFWLRRPSQLASVPRVENPFWARVLAVWLHAALFASAIATVGSLTGWTNLAELLIGTVLSGTFAGSILFTAVLVVEGIAEASARGGQLERIRIIHHDPDGFLHVVRRVARSVAFVTWLSRLLDYLAIQHPVLAALQTALATPLGFGNMHVTFGGLLAFGIAIWASWVLSRFVAVFLDREIFTRVRLPRGVPFALATISRYTVLVLGFLLAVAALGVEVGNLALLVSAFGVGIGFGLQNTVNNFISGLMLLFERPIKVGDRISIDELLGEVKRIGIRASVVRTFDGADVIVPNGDLISNQVTNWTLADTRRRVILSVGVSYGTPARRVIELLHGIAEANPDILADPAPLALFVGFGDSSLDFELRVWTESEDALTLVRSDLAIAIQDALADANIEVPFPQRDLHLKTLPGDETTAARSGNSA